MHPDATILRLGLHDSLLFFPSKFKMLVMVMNRSMEMLEKVPDLEILELLNITKRGRKRVRSVLDMQIAQSMFFASLLSFHSLASRVVPSSKLRKRASMNCNYLIV